MKTSNRLAL
ncbi:hypothetical protein CP8484711_1494, partial [Chlamydia psittaci 84-8471/1]